MRIVLWSNTYFYNSQVGKVTPESTFCRATFLIERTNDTFKTYQTGPCVQFAKHLPAFTRRR